MVADTRIQAYPFDNLLAVQPLAFSIAVELVEIGNAQRQIGVSEQFDRFRFGGVGKQGWDILLDRAFFQQISKTFGTRRALTNDNTRWVQVVVQRTSFTQELRRENNIINP